MTATARYTGTLTTEHLDRIHATRAEWMTTALTLHQPDRSTAEAAIRHLYQTHGLPPPLLTIWMDSPLGCIYAAAVISQLGGQLWEQLGDQLGDQLGGQLGDQLYDWIYRAFHPWNDAYWLAFYDCALPIAGLPPSPKLTALASAVTELGWWIPTRGAAILSGRPTRLRRDADGQLHSHDGPALAYPDGWGFHAWHGRRVPQWVIEQPTVEAIAAEPNVEIRRCAIESMGWDRFLAELTTAGQMPRTAVSAAPDPGNPGQQLQLYDVPERLWGSRIRLLLCTNGSPERDGTRRRYGLTVPAGIEDPVEAAAWTAGLTKDQYALMQRRT